MIARRIASLAAIAIAVATTGCCKIIALLDEAADRDPAPTGPATELGTAVFPEGAATTPATNHTWLAKQLSPSTYRVRYALSPDEASAVSRDLDAYARKVSYQSDGKDRFRWKPPPGCASGMTCVYQAIATRSVADIQPIAAKFRARGKAAKLSTLDLAQLVVTFVQAIPYEIPEKEPFGLLPPALVASRRKGDCDSKSLLAHMILRELGIDSIMVGSVAHHHGMLGIALPVPGTKFTHAGRQYAFTEMTAKGSPIGHINPRLLAPNDWKPQPIDIGKRASK